MDYKIIFSDIDGTLLNKERELSPATIKAIKKLKNNIPFVLISARMPSAMRHLQKELDISHLPIICYNGGLILNNDLTLSSTEIPMYIIESLHEWNYKNPCHLSLYHRDEWYVPKMDQWALREINNTKVNPEVLSNSETIRQWKTKGKGAHKIMAMGGEEKIDEIRDFLESTFPGELHLYRSKNTYLEIAPKSISKFTAIEILLDQHFGFDVEEAIAIGDNYNDVEMLQKIGHGVAVGNARPEAIEAAKQVAGHSVEDGVARILEEIFLLK